ncbi:MAG: SdiA-regulated family protein [Ferruginibacter sp.]|nr:SdiA-regulated family protein [Ferruginibacter sp.]
MIKLISSLIFILFFYGACKQHEQIAGPPGYDLTKPVVLKMPVALNEISGIAFNKGNPDTIYAEQDEEGRLFYFATGSQDVKHQKFGKKGDYEDIAICNGTVAMLRSDGALFSFPLNINGDKEISNVQEAAGILPAGEYEAMFADEANNLLYVLCKECSEDNAAKNISGYILQILPGGQFASKDNFRINTKDIAAKLVEKKIVFRPSAMAKNHLQNEWYIVSSVNKLLVITDTAWVVKAAYPLDPALFNQPEGIAFDSNNNLYISNERGNTASATILKFTFAKDKK